MSAWIEVMNESEKWDDVLNRRRGLMTKEGTQTPHRLSEIRPDEKTIHYITAAGRGQGLFQGAIMGSSICLHAAKGYPIKKAPILERWRQFFVYQYGQDCRIEIVDLVNTIPCKEQIPFSRMKTDIGPFSRGYQQAIKRQMQGYLYKITEDDLKRLGLFEQSYDTKKGDDLFVN
jgi:hypothetical protein